MKVIVIGCGPAGLAAAHAAVGLGAEVTIYAERAEQTPQNGPLLIQRPIPGINTGHPDGTIHQLVIGGSILDYRYKLYGDVNIGINGDILQPQYHAWRHRETYNLLWDMYEDRVIAQRISGRRMLELQDEADLVVSTGNAEKLCMTPSWPVAGTLARTYGHDFVSANVWVTPHASYPDQPDNTIIFNAGDLYPWVRSSVVFGVPVTEWTAQLAPSGARMITKPISTTCKCFPRVLRTGRFGAWKNETWVDTAYWDTYSAIKALTRKPELEVIK